MDNRYYAFFVHLVVSALVLLTIYFLARTIWYPEYFYDLDGGFEASKVIFLVDLVLGPLLTLLIYKPKKKGLMFDLSCIVLMQLMALSYGIYLLYSYRPVALVMQNNSFFSVTADVYKNYGVKFLPDSSNDSIKKCGLSCYILENSYESRTNIMSKGIPARVSQEFYIDYSEGWKAYIESSSSFFDVSKLTDKQKTELITARTKLSLVDKNRNESDLGFIPIHGRYIEGYFIVNRNSGQILSFVEQKLLFD